MKRLKITPPLLDQINITPMLDTAMTLLLIFVIISPIIGRGIAVKLPVAGGEKLPVTTTVLISIEEQGAIFLGGKRTDPSSLAVELRSLKEANPDLKVVVQADRDVRYQTVVSVLDMIRKAGIKSVGLATNPPPSRRI